MIKEFFKNKNKYVILNFKLIFYIGLFIKIIIMINKN